MSIAHQFNKWIQHFATARTIRWLLVAIIILGAVLRLYRINSVPNGLNPDEAALAYNAVMLRDIGRDEWGQRWPLVLKSFGDYKLPGYPTMLVGLFLFLPTQDWVVRLPAAIAGIGLILVVYLLARQLRMSRLASLVVASLVATQPALIFYSRSAYEAMVALSLVFLLLVLLNHKLKPTIKVAAVTALFLTACLIYNSPLLLTPVLILLTWLKPASQFTKRTRLLISVGIAAVAGLLWWQFQPLLAQKTSITIFSDPTFWFKYLDWRASLAAVWWPIAKYPVYLLLEIGRRLVESFGPFFLVWHGGQHPWHTLEGWGHLHLMTYILGVGGILATASQLIVAWLRHQWSRLARPMFLLIGLFGGLLPAIITVDAPHATRSLLFLVFFCLMAGVGVDWLTSRLPRWRVSVFLAVLMVTLITTGQFMEKYFRFYPNYSRIMQRTGLSAAALKALNQDPGKTVGILASDYQYVNLAWNAQIPPQVFLDTVTRYPKNIIGFEFVKNVSSFRFLHGLDERTDEKYVLMWDDQTDQWQEIL